MTSYSAQLNARIVDVKTPTLVGLDPRWDLLPEEIRRQSTEGNSCTQMAQGFEVFCREIIDIVAPLVSAVKPQVAFFEELGPAGLSALRHVMSYARDKGLIVIADAKRGDIGSTATAYAAAWLAGEDPDAAPFPANALTINAYLGEDTLEPFVKAAVQRNAGLYVLVRTSNPGASVFQNHTDNSRTLYEVVADVVQQLNLRNWPDDAFGSVGAVVGATWPKELSALRERMPNTPLLIPGYGSQGGTAADVAAAFNNKGLGALVNSSRGINFAYREARYADQFPQHKWRDAIEAATREMIADLGQHVRIIG